MRFRLPTSAKIVALHLAVQISTATVVLAYISKQLEESFTREAVEVNETLIENTAALIRASGGVHAKEIVEIINKESARHGYEIHLMTPPPSQSRPLSELMSSQGVRTRQAISENLGLEAVNDMREAQKLNRIVAMAFVGALLLGAEAGVILAYFLLRSTRRRIVRIADVADDVGRGNLSRRIEIKNDGSPFDRLGMVLNAMFLRLDDVLRELRAVTDAVAHDVRSPLMRMRVHAERALSSRRLSDARPLLAKVLKEADVALRITSLAVELSRAEAGIDRSDFVTVDLAELVRDLIDAYEPAARARGLQLKLEIHDSSPTVFGHNQLLGQVVSNLVDNVFRHAIHGGVCEVKVDRMGGQIRLQVSDRGQGVAMGDMDRVLARFVKLNVSRSSPGAGLGLALVDAIVRLHEGAIRLENNEPGLRVVIVFPAQVRISV